MELEEALDTLKIHLFNLNKNQRYSKVDYCFEDNEGNFSSDSSPAAALARDWCHELLKSGDANGLGGCKLCRS